LYTFYSPRLITILNINADDYVSLLLFQYLAPIGVKNLITDQWLKTDALKRKELNGNHKSSETLQHNQNRHKLQTHSDSCLMTSFIRRDSEDYQTPLCMICFNILSNKGLKVSQILWTFRYQTQ